MRNVDVPPPDEVTASWWAATGEHRLTVQTCGACGAVQHPPRAVCIHCGLTDKLFLQDCQGGGVVDSFTVTHLAPVQDLDVPYVIARVRLDEGVVLLSRLEGRDDPYAWRIDDKVQVDWVDLDDGRALPIFQPEV